MIKKLHKGTTGMFLIDVILMFAFIMASLIVSSLQVGSHAKEKNRINQFFLSLMDRNGMRPTEMTLLDQPGPPEGVLGYCFSVLSFQDPTIHIRFEKPEKGILSTLRAMKKEMKGFNSERFSLYVSGLAMYFILNHKDSGNDCLTIDISVRDLGYGPEHYKGYYDDYDLMEQAITILNKYPLKKGITSKGKVKGVDPWFTNLGFQYHSYDMSGFCYSVNSLVKLCREIVTYKNFSSLVRPEIDFSKLASAEHCFSFDVKMEQQRTGSPNNMALVDFLEFCDKEFAKQSAIFKSLQNPTSWNEHGRSHNMRLEFQLFKGRQLKPLFLRLTSFSHPQAAFRFPKFEDWMKTISKKFPQLCSMDFGIDFSDSP